MSESKTVRFCTVCTAGVFIKVGNSEGCVWCSGTGVMDNDQYSYWYRRTQNGFIVVSKTSFKRDYNEP